MKIEHPSLEDHVLLKTRGVYQNKRTRSNKSIFEKIWSYLVNAVIMVGLIILAAAFSLGIVYMLVTGPQWIGFGMAFGGIACLMIGTVGLPIKYNWFWIKEKDASQQIANKIYEIPKD